MIGSFSKHKSTNNTLVLDSSTIVKSTQPKYTTNVATNGRSSTRLDPLDTNSQTRLGSFTSGRPSTSGRVNTSVGLSRTSTPLHHPHHPQRPSYQQRSSVGVITASSVSSGDVEITYRQNTQRRHSQTANATWEASSATRRLSTQKSSVSRIHTADTFVSTVVSKPPVSANTATQADYGSVQHHGTRNYDKRKRGIHVGTDASNHSLQASTFSRSQDLSAFTAYAKGSTSISLAQSNSITANSNPYQLPLPPSQIPGRVQATDACFPFSSNRDPTVLEKYIRDQQQFVGFDQKNPEFHGSRNRIVERESAGSSTVEIGTQTVQIDMSSTEWDLFEFAKTGGIDSSEGIDYSRQSQGYDSDIEADEELAALDWTSFHDVGDRASQRGAFHATNSTDPMARKLLHGYRPSGPDIDMMILGKRMDVLGTQVAEDEEVFLEEGMGKIGWFRSSPSSSEEDRADPGPFNNRKSSSQKRPSSHNTKKSHPYSRPAPASIYTHSTTKSRPPSPSSNNSNSFRHSPPRNCIRPVPSRLCAFPHDASSATNTPYSAHFSSEGARSPLRTPSTTSSALSSSVEDLSSSSHSVSSYSTIPSSVSSPDSTKIAHLVTDGTRSAFSPTQHLFANLLDQRGERVSSTGGHLGKGTDNAFGEGLKQEKVWDWQHMLFFHLERQRVGGSGN